MWRCLRCGHAFVGVNMAHSCVTVSLDALFARSTPDARAAFDAFVELIERCGPVDMIGQKTRIVVAARTRFAGAIVLRDRVRLYIALTRQIDAPWVERIDTYFSGRWNATTSLHAQQRMSRRSPELAAIVCEGYRDLGRQGALRSADPNGAAR